MQGPKRIFRIASLHTAAACLSWLAAATASANARSYVFDVLLDGKTIGTHSFHVSPAADGLQQIRSDAALDVKLLGVTLYRYRHRAEEHWSAGCLERIEADTSDNGRRLAVRGGRAAGGLRLDAPAGGETRAGCVSTYAYWDPERLLQQRELLNPQTGKFDAVSIDALGEEPLQVRGVQSPARRYRLRSAEFTIELWYSPDGQWLQLTSTTSGNRRLLYRLRP